MEAQNAFLCYVALELSDTGAGVPQLNCEFIITGTNIGETVMFQ